MELPPLPAGFAGTRESLHRLAEDVIKPAREQTSGEWTLTETPGGFGTPIFGDDCQVRVEGAELVVREGGDERRAPIGSPRRGGRADRARACCPRASGACRPSRSRSTPPPARRWPPATRSPARCSTPARQAPDRRLAERADALARALRPGDRAGGGGRRAAGQLRALARATRTTPSRTSTSAPGRPSTTASSGTPAASPAPSSATVSWRRAPTRSGSPSTSA